VLHSGWEEIALRQLLVCFGICAICGRAGQLRFDRGHDSQAILICGLGRQLDVEADCNFVFCSYACFSRGLDAELGLLHGGFAREVAVFHRDLHGDGVGLAVQGEISAQRPAAFTGGFRRGGFEDDFRIPVAIENIGAEHGGLDVGAIFVGGVFIEDAQIAGVHVDFDCGVGARVGGAAVNGGTDFVLVSESREGAGLADVNGQRGFLGIHVALLGGGAQSAPQDRNDYKRDAFHRSPRAEFSSRL
jgi:hypothetical protein